MQYRDAFELAPWATPVYHARSPWKDDASRPATVLQGNETQVFELVRFEVLTHDVVSRLSRTEVARKTGDK